LAWVRQFIENQNDVDDAEDIVQGIKTDLDIADVFVFTPKGDVITLPEGSTVIDFAYAIHTAVGNRMVGAKVDGRIVPLDYRVKMGEIVEVLTATAKDRGPSRDWINIVHTSEARNKIRGWFKRERREENIQQGREELERELSRNFIRLPEERMEAFLLAQSKKQHYANLDDFYAAIGYGGVLLSRLMPRLKDEYARIQREEQIAAAPVAATLTPATKRTKNNGGVIIDNMDNCLVKFAQCCNPVPGDDIVGFITRGRGISIHRKDCSNVVNVPEEEKDRIIEASWIENAVAKKEEGFLVEIKIFATDRSGLLNDLTKVFSEKDISIMRISSMTSKQGIATLMFGFEVKSREELHEIIARLQSVRDVRAIKRSNG
jgi:GTP pyrophosphokinase